MSNAKELMTEAEFGAAVLAVAVAVAVFAGGVGGVAGVFLLETAGKALVASGGSAMMGFSSGFVLAVWLVRSAKRRHAAAQAGAPRTE